MADCSDCLELVTEDGQDQGDYRGHCLHCRQEITVQGPGPGAPYPGDPRASGVVPIMPVKCQLRLTRT